MIDYYSKYPELCILKDKTASSVVTSMKSVFARQGIPDEVVADNMPFSSKAVNLQVSEDSKSLHQAPDTHSLMA